MTPRIIAAALAASLAASFLALAFSGSANAQAFPNKPVSVIIPFAPGGSNDLVGRPLVEKLRAKWGVPVVLLNVPGAGSAIGSARVARSDPDGYTLMLSSTSFTMMPAIQANLTFNPATDLKPVAKLGTTQMALVVGPTIKAKTLPEFMNEVRSRSVTYGTSGLGSINHFAAELFRDATKLNMRPVHYKGGTEASLDLIGGRIDMYMSTVDQAVPRIRAGELTGFAVTGETRSLIAPELPTFAEAGIKGMDLTQWWGVYAPAGTPDAIVDFLNREINEVMAQDDSKAHLAKFGAEPSAMNPKDFAMFVKSELEKWAITAKNADIQPQ